MELDVRLDLTSRGSQPEMKLKVGRSSDSTTQVPQKSVLNKKLVWVILMINQFR